MREHCGSLRSVRCPLSISLDSNSGAPLPGRGYFQEQATKPQTLAYSLADSPVGLLAWIYEKLVTWTDKYPWTEDEGLLLSTHNLRVAADVVIAVLTWIHIYAFGQTQSSSSAATSIRIYWEYNNANDWASIGSPEYYNGSVPMGISIFPRELVVVPQT